MASTHRCIAVRTAAEHYNIHIGPGVLSAVGTHVTPLTPGRRVFVVSHPTLYRLYGATLTTSLRQAGFSVTSCLLAEGEGS